MTVTYDPDAIDRQAELVTDFNVDHFPGTWVRYWTGTRQDPAKYGQTRTKAELLGGHTAVVWVTTHGACIALTHVDVIPGQPDDVEDDSNDLPEPGPAAARVVAYIAANGDGIYDLIDGHPLYARDLEALRRAGEEVEQLRAELATVEQQRDRHYRDFYEAHQNWQRVEAALTESRTNAATYATEVGRLVAENARVRQDRDEAKAELEHRRVEVDELRAVLQGPVPAEGPWKALIVHEGWVADDFSELQPSDEVDIVIVRDSSLPDDEGHMPGTYKTDDVAFEARDIYVDGDGGTDAPTIYARAQVMAGGLNAAEAVTA